MTDKKEIMQSDCEAKLELEKEAHRIGACYSYNIFMDAEVFAGPGFSHSGSVWSCIKFLKGLERDGTTGLVKQIEK